MTPPSALLYQRYWPALACLGLAALLLWLQPPRQISAGLALLAWLGICALNWRALSPSVPPIDGNGAQWLVAYASQSGQAQALAERSAAQLREAGLPARAAALDALTPQGLAGLERLLLVASSYGEGEAPDNAARFQRQLARTALDLSRLDYALLALGDSDYRHFCGFARRLDSRLQQLGGRPLFDRLEADRGDPAVLRQWQQQLGLLAGKHDFADWQAPAYQAWPLLARHCLNPGSRGRPAFRLRLLPPGDAPVWQAGDIAEIGPCQPAERIEALLQRIELDGQQTVQDGQTLAWQLARRQLPEACSALRGLDAEALLQKLPRLPRRDYSIASLPSDGTLELLVRQQQDAAGNLGLGSGWLCRHAPLGASVELRIRSNPAFRLPIDSGPLILIGNGTGLAGLRAHLRERQQLGQHGHWLLFGERNAACDLFFADELRAWQRSGHLARLDLAFSRDQAQPVYVQHLLRDAGDQLRAWIERGASLLVCGSLEGMGEEIDALLHGLLGAQQVQALREAGRYRRDLY
ncbi:sulfite reductase subunit alpha [Pseudomonas sp. NPDC077186]|uniref:sulfite reductase subunit alpha n=1 Tax=Pseudomonas sp. NPDC077186 TaxID=3364421 RepID=UPI0037CC32B6